MHNDTTDNNFIDKEIERCKKRGIHPGLEVMEDLLAALGHPEENLRIVHIAGTNGKGSTLAFLASILEEAGFRAGRYVSPAVTCYEEHFIINGSFIKRDRLAAYYEVIKNVTDLFEKEGKLLPTLFEVETAIAFLYFRDEKVDYVLLETGMGGLQDATNVVKSPVLTMISSVSYDHMDWLGHTLEEIAAQKAGIIKPRVPLILGENPGEVLFVIEEKAKACHSPCIRVSKDSYEILEEDEEGTGFRWQGISCRIRLPGRHQVSNAVTALYAASYLLKEKDFSKGMALEEILCRGLERTRWPGRLELIGRDPLIYLDGAHNPEGAMRLAEFLQKHFTNRRIIYIIGVLKDKEYEKMLSFMLPLAWKVYVFRPDNDRGLDAGILAETVRSMGREAQVCGNVREALCRAGKEADRSDVLVVWGSLSFMKEIVGHENRES